MKIRKKGQVLAMTLALAAAASMMSSGVSQVYAQSYNVTPAMLVVKLQESVQAGDLALAKALITRLQAMGIVNIVIDGQTFAVADLAVLIDSDPAQLVAVLTFTAGVPVNAAFQVATNTSTSEKPTKELFPTSSAG